MIDPKSATAPFPGGSDEGARPATAAKGGDAYPMLRQLGGRAYQLLAAARGADHFIAQESAEDRDTGSWLIACAVGLAEDLAADLDGLAKNLKANTGEANPAQAFQKLRARAHQLHAATRAADHFLEQDNNVDRSTGSWLIACALGLADKLANELEDLANGMRRSPGDVTLAAGDSPPARRGGSAAAPLRSATN